MKFSCICNLNNRFIGLCDYWIVINNSSKPFTFVAEVQGATDLKVHDEPV
jgi:predicted ABC-type ATPase